MFMCPHTYSMNTYTYSMSNVERSHVQRCSLPFNTCACPYICEPMYWRTYSIPHCNIPLLQYKTEGMQYGVATIRRLLEIIGLFCKTVLQKRLYSANETYNLTEPTNRSHPIVCCRRALYRNFWLTLAGLGFCFFEQIKP